MISGTIRGYIDHLDDFLEEDEDDTEPQSSISAKTGKNKKEDWNFEHVHLGSRQRAIAISSFIDNDDPAFDNFSQKLGQCIHDILMHEHIDSCEQRGTFTGSVIPPFPVVKDSDLVSLVNA